jgi:AcrR family transcriptional regulator
MAAARQCIFTHGVAGTSVQDISELAQVARSSFYRHFRDLDDVLVALAIGIWTEQLVTLTGEVQAIAGTRARWTHYVVRMVNSGAALQAQDNLFSEDHFVRLVRLFYRGPQRPIDALVAVMTPLLDSGQTSGELRTDVSAAELAVWLLRQSWALCSAPPFGGWQAEELARYIETFVLPSLLRPSPDQVPDLLPAAAAGQPLQDQISELTEVIRQLHAQVQTLLTTRG